MEVMASGLEALTRHPHCLALAPLLQCRSHVSAIHSARTGTCDCHSALCRTALSTDRSSSAMWPGPAPRAFPAFSLNLHNTQVSPSDYLPFIKAQKGQATCQGHTARSGSTRKAPSPPDTKP